MEQANVLVPKWSLIVCPDCEFHIATTNRDILQDESIELDCLDFHCHDYWPECPIVCPKCNRPFDISESASRLYKSEGLR